jgi:hypothetical protein
MGAMSCPKWDPTWYPIQPVPTNEEATVYARNAFSLRCIGCWSVLFGIGNIEVLFYFEFKIYIKPNQKEV